MVPYCQQFCNAFPASSPPAWQGPGADERRHLGHPRRVVVVWRALGLAGPARIRWSPQAGHTSARLSTTNPHVTHTYSLMQRSVACMWWTPRSVGLIHDHTSTRRRQPHAAAMAGAYLGAPDCSAVIPEHKHGVRTALSQRFHGLPRSRPQPKELTHTTQLLTQHGEAKAHSLLDFSHQAACETHYQPQTFMGILHYLPRALAASTAQVTPAPPAPAHAQREQEQRWQDQYAQWRQDALTRLRAALPAAERATLEAAIEARLLAERPLPAFALPLAVRTTLDTVLEDRAGLPDFAAWRQAQEACG